MKSADWLAHVILDLASLTVPFYYSYHVTLTCVFHVRAFYSTSNNNKYIRNNIEIFLVRRLKKENRIHIYDTTARY